MAGEFQTRLGRTDVEFNWSTIFTICSKYALEVSLKFQFYKSR
jgi:hypothetical protein